MSGIPKTNLRYRNGKHSSLHYWIRYHYGKADHCEQRGCLGISKRFEWAKIKGKRYAYKIENFMQLCKQCHTKYDIRPDFGAKMRRALKGRKLVPIAYINSAKATTGIPRTQEVKEKISSAQIGKPKRMLWKRVYQFTLEGKLVASHESLSSVYKVGFDRQGVGRCCVGDYISSQGYKWSYKKALIKSR